MNSYLSGCCTCCSEFGFLSSMEYFDPMHCLLCIDISFSWLVEFCRYISQLAMLRRTFKSEKAQTRIHIYTTFFSFSNKCQVTEKGNKEINQFCKSRWILCFYIFFCVYFMFRALIRSEKCPFLNFGPITRISTSTNFLQLIWYSLKF